MSSSAMCIQLHELVVRMPKSICTHQIFRNFTKSCTYSCANDRSRGSSWYRTAQQESLAKQRRSENSTTDQWEDESGDGRSFITKRSRITRPAVQAHDTRRSEEPRFQRNFESPRESFGDDEPSFWPTQVRRNQVNSRQERMYPGDKNFRKTEQGHASEDYVRPKKWSTNRPAKSYNYGLTGLGKELPQKLKASPAVKGEILYGIHSALLALVAGRRDFHKFYVRDSLLESERPAIQQLMALVREKEIDLEVCNKSLLTSLSQARPHQGVCLDAGHLDYETLGSDELIYESSSNVCLEPRLFVILDSVQDPMNLGAVIRSSYFLGVDQLFVVKDNSCSLTPVVSKSSAGAMEISKIYAVPDLIEFLEDFKERGWDLLGTTSSLNSNPDQVVLLKDLALKRNTILVLGNEGSGLTENVESRCHQLVRIPPGRNLHPLIDCLNVSVATGIILHHLCQFKTSPKRVA